MNSITLQRGSTNPLRAFIDEAQRARTASVEPRLVFALDAIAIAAQAITGRTLGEGDVVRTRSATTLMVRWGIIAGFALGVELLAANLAFDLTHEGRSL